MGKLTFKGEVIGIQPRIQLIRSFDSRSHVYLGYTLHLEGMIEDEERIFSVGIGNAN